MTIFLWLVMILSLIGTVLNVYKVRWCFLLWGIGNLTWAAIDFHKGIPQQGVLMLIYFGISIWGWISWGKK